MKNITIIIASCILFLAYSLKAQEKIITPTLTTKKDSLPKIKEFGFGFSSLFSTSYSLQYRWGTEKRLFRVNGNINGFTAFGKNSGSTSQSQDTLSNTSSTSSGNTKTPLSLSSSLSISMLHIKYLVKKFGIIYGPLVGITYSNVTNQSISPGTATTYYNYYPTPPHTANFPINVTTKIHSETIQPYLGFAFGAFYKINKSFFLYAEIAPNVYYQRLNSTSNSTTVNSYNNSPPQPQQYNNYTNNTKSSTNTLGISSLANTAATLTLVYRITSKKRKLHYLKLSVF